MNSSSANVHFASFASPDTSNSLSPPAGWSPTTVKVFREASTSVYPIAANARPLNSKVTVLTIRNLSGRAAANSSRTASGSTSSTADKLDLLKRYRAAGGEPEDSESDEHKSTHAQLASIPSPMSRRYNEGTTSIDETYPPKTPVTIVTPMENSIGCRASRSAPVPIKVVTAESVTAVRVPVFKSWW